ncbi:MAG TPA: ATP-binding protein [Methanospirillum sp.]|nr:ATP-binding protein [Methanospirillum sp.]
MMSESNQEQEKREGENSPLGQALSIIQNVINAGIIPKSPLPGYPEEQRVLQEILDTIKSVQHFTAALAEGRLDSTLPVRGHSAGSLKALQSSLRHLTWQTHMIADGDLTQRVDFMGEFSTSFNKMVESLDMARRDLQSREEDLRKALDQVRESNQKYMTIVEEIPDPILITRPDDLEVIEINKGFLRVFGTECNYSSSGCPWPVQICSKRPDSERLIEIIKAGTVVSGLEMPLLTNEGHIFFGSISAAPIQIAGQDASLLIIHDIDAVKRAQQALAQANSKLNILSSITRHDILNKVMVITYYCTFIRDHVTDTVSLERLDAIKQSGEDIQHLIEFTRQYEDLGVNEPIWQRPDKILSLPEITSILNDVTVSVPEKTIQINADLMLEKVLYNLIENSIRHGGTVKRIRITGVVQGLDLLLTYEDDGQGIPENEKEIIFKRGYGKNTGMGLFMIREILSITGISIRECGIPEEGVRFEMTVPYGKYRIIEEESE